MDRTRPSPAARRLGARLPIAMFWTLVVALIGARIALFQDISLPAAATAFLGTILPG